MKKNILRACLIILVLAFNAAAQKIPTVPSTPKIPTVPTTPTAPTAPTISIVPTVPATPTPMTVSANPADVASLDAIMKAVYDVISGDAGQKRDWDRFRSLFYKDARLIPSGKNPATGVVGARSLSAEDYVTRASANMEKEGFFEREIARRTDIYGNIAHVFSTYESLHKKDDKTPFARGINSFQLLNDGKRWWVLTIYWQGETPETPIPSEYLKSKID